MLPRMLLWHRVAAQWPGPEEADQRDRRALVLSARDMTKIEESDAGIDIPLAGLVREIRRRPRRPDSFSQEGLGRVASEPAAWVSRGQRRRPRRGAG